MDYNNNTQWNGLLYVSEDVKGKQTGLRLDFTVMFRSEREITLKKTGGKDIYFAFREGAMLLMLTPCGKGYLFEARHLASLRHVSLHLTTEEKEQKTKGKGECGRVPRNVRLLLETGKFR
ncbi:hypothetical protein SRHO_G00073040 [Serrasalmus rhombeus]